MEAILGSLPQLADLIQKAGVVGLLLIVSGVLVWEVLRLRKELTRVYAHRDKWRVGYTLCKAALDARNIVIDLSSMQDVEHEDAPA